MKLIARLLVILLFLNLCFFVFADDKPADSAEKEKEQLVSLTEGTQGDPEIRYRFRDY